METSPPLFPIGCSANEIRCDSTVVLDAVPQPEDLGTLTLSLLALEFAGADVGQ